MKVVVALGGNAMLLLADVDAVYRDWGGRAPLALRETSPAELRRYSFAPGSMKPKVEAARRFVESGGALAAIGRLEDAGRLLEGMGGTIVRRANAGLDFA